MSSPTFETGRAPTAWSSGSAATFSSNADRVGRDGRLELRFERGRGGATVLAARRFTLPLEALEPMALDPAGGAAVLMLLNPTGGIVGGDRLATEVELGPGARACLVTPGATKVYRTRGPAAEQALVARVGAGAAFEYVPDHLIPSPGAALRQAIDVTLGAGAVAIVFDALAAGRLARGERWRMAEIETTLTVRDEAGLRLRDRARLAPARRPLERLTDGAGYVAALGLFFEGDSGPLAAELGLALEPPVRGGVARLARGGLLVRFLAASAPELLSLRDRLWRIARLVLLGAPPPPLRKS